MKKKDNLKVKEDYLQKIKFINKYNKYYYSDSKPLVDDSIFDKIKLDILNLEKKYSFLKSKESPSLIVGFKPSKSFKKVDHKVPMLSLGNASIRMTWLILKKFLTLSLKKSKNRI